MPSRRAFRTASPVFRPGALDRLCSRPMHRGAALSVGPADNDTGVPFTPSDGDPRLPSLHPARDDTETADWDETTASKQDSDENRDGDLRPQHKPEDSQEHQKIVTIDDTPSPADVPDDMKYDPGGEGTPGLMPPVPAPVPGDVKATQGQQAPQGLQGAPKSPDDYNGMDYLLGPEFQPS